MRTATMPPPRSIAPDRGGGSTHGQSVPIRWETCTCDFQVRVPAAWGSHKVEVISMCQHGSRGHRSRKCAATAFLGRAHAGTGYCKTIESKERRAARRPLAAHSPAQRVLNVWPRCQAGRGAPVGLARTSGDHCNFMVVVERRRSRRRPKCLIYLAPLLTNTPKHAPVRDPFWVFRVGDWHTHTWTTKKHRRGGPRCCRGQPLRLSAPVLCSVRFCPCSGLCLLSAPRGVCCLFTKKTSRPSEAKDFTTVALDTL